MNVPLSESVQSTGNDSHELEEVMREINDSFPIESPKGQYESLMILGLFRPPNLPKEEKQVKFVIVLLIKNKDQ